MKRVVIGLALSLSLATPAYANSHGHERRRCYEDCDRDGQNGRRNGDDGREDGRRKDTCLMLCNNIIIVPNPVPGGQQPSSIACLIPVPYHCDPKPGGGEYET